jgi:hypothetical protein
MTTQIRTAAVFASTALATVITALVLSSASSQAEVSTQVHQLPRVVVTGKVVRPAATPLMIELPRVVVTGRKIDIDAKLVAQTAARGEGV